MQTKRKARVRYPIAYTLPYRVTHIGEAERGTEYLCLGCSGPMTPRKGQVKRHHFAHKADLEQCDPDSALHETSKAAISQGFLRAQEQREEFPISFPCLRCGTSLKVNTAIEGASIATERAVVQGTKSDLVISKENGVTPRVIIEVVVHHDIEEETKNRYRESGIPVARVRPDWETVDELRHEIRVKEMLNVPNPTCRRCKEDQRRLDEWKGDFERKAKAKIAPTQTATARVAEIRRDRFGSFLRPDTRRQVNQNARTLAEIGFTQNHRRPTLFNVRVDEWTIYADLDSTQVMKIWEVGCAPGLYAFPEEPAPPRCRECVVETVRKILEEKGIEIRRYFMDHGSHNHWHQEFEDDLDIGPDTYAYRPSSRRPEWDEASLDEEADGAWTSAISGKAVPRRNDPDSRLSNVADMASTPDEGWCDNGGMSKRGRSARKTPWPRREQPPKATVRTQSNGRPSTGETTSPWTLTPVADRHSLRLTAECMADVAASVTRTDGLLRTDQLTARLFQRECRDISTRLRKLLLPGGEELLKRCFATNMHPLTTAGGDNSPETLTQRIGNSAVGYTVGQDPEPREESFQSEHEHETVIGPLYGLRHMGNLAYQFHDPFDWSVPPLSLKKWLNLKVLRVDDATISAETTLRIVADKEGAHSELDEMATSNPQMPVSIIMGDPEEEPYRRANVVNFSGISYPQVFTFLVAFYLARMMRTSLKHIPPDLTKFGYSDEIWRDILRTPTGMPRLRLVADRPYMMGVLLQNSLSAYGDFTLIGDYRTPSRTVVRIP